MSIEFMHAAPDFSDPLGLLAACHGRIEAQCATLLRLPDHLRQHGTDEQARQAAVKILKYFNSAGKHHHEDEENDLFPLLIEIATSENYGHLLTLIVELQNEHLKMELAWQELTFFLEKIAVNQHINPDHLPVTHFAELYRSHIARENQHIFSYARQKLSMEQLSTLGLNMMTRRNVQIRQV